MQQGITSFPIGDGRGRSPPPNAGSFAPALPEQVRDLLLMLVEQVDQQLQLVVGRHALAGIPTHEGTQVHAELARRLGAVVAAPQRSSHLLEQLPFHFLNSVRMATTAMMVPQIIDRAMRCMIVIKGSPTAR